MKTWKLKLRSNYSTFAEWREYSKMYDLAARLGFSDEQAAWDANPMIQGSVNPGDFKVVPPRAPKNERCKNQTIRCYDNGGTTIDRYTVVYLDQPERAANTFAAVAMSGEPFHPQGFGQHTTAQPGQHLGKRVTLASLPADCQKLVLQDCTPEIDDFTRGYITCALWSSIGDDGEPLDKDHSQDDLAAATLEKMLADCRKFQADNGELLAQVDYPKNDSTNMAHAGHDFWLTRNGHGSGFWDGDLPEDLGNALTAASKKFWQFDLYLGDDGLIYV